MVMRARARVSRPRGMGAARLGGVGRGWPPLPRDAVLRLACWTALASLVGALAVSVWPGEAGASGSPSTVYRWGVVGNRGAITRLQLSRPSVIQGISGKVVEIATSNSDGYALTSNGQVYGWGVNTYGELGDGRTTPYETRATKVSFPKGVKITALANPMPFDAALAIDSTGHAWGWGLNAANDVCLSRLFYTRPARLSLSGVSLATGARTHSLLYARGTLYACGSGDAGELGTSSTAAASAPQRVVGLPAGVKVTALTSSWEGSGALLANGDYYNWGYNASGQLGDGTTADSSVPVKVDLQGRVAQVFQGGSGPRNGQTIVVLDDRSVWAWGSNSRGQLGDGTRIAALRPVRVKVPRGVVFTKVSSGGYASYAIDSTGRLWSWGDNREGQLGTGARPRRTSLPIAVGLRLGQVSSTAQNVAGLS